ncbi:MAG: D-aminoacyl-tRNA deacylase [Alkalispirochaeta sp.]
MRGVVQLVSSASVTVDGRTVGSVDRGYLVLLGIHRDDTEDDLEYIARKILGLRIFPDDQGRMNRSITDIDGSILLVSQFTLQGDTTKGRRPGFDRAAPPDLAIPLYEKMITRMRREVPVATGEFGAKMRVSLVNEGPVTFILDSFDR